MHLPGLTSLQVFNPTLEALTQAALILFLAVAIVASNVLIIATIVNFRGKLVLNDIFVNNCVGLTLSHCHNSGSIGGNQPLLAITGHSGSIMRSNNSSTVRLSSTHRRMVVRRFGMSFCWLPRGDTVVGDGVHLYVDIGR